MIVNYIALVIYYLFSTIIALLFALKIKQFLELSDKDYETLKFIAKCPILNNIFVGCIIAVYFKNL